MNDINFLTLQQVINLHEIVVGQFGGASGIRDRNILESSIYQPQITVFGQYAYDNIYKMAAAYCFHIVKNHPFVDGNKRTGVLSASVFLELKWSYTYINF